MACKDQVKGQRIVPFKVVSSSVRNSNTARTASDRTPGVEPCRVRNTRRRVSAARSLFALEVVQATAEVGDVWQAHRTMTDDAAHQTEDALIANVTEEDDCEGHWIKATVQTDGRTWTITNGRTGYSRSYQSK